LYESTLAKIESSCPRNHSGYHHKSIIDFTDYPSRYRLTIGARKYDKVNLEAFAQQSRLRLQKRSQ